MHPSIALVLGSDPPPYWFAALTVVLNVLQTVALAYITSRWRAVNGQLREVQQLAAANEISLRDKALELEAERRRAYGP